ncbi:cobalt-precorrin-6A reductase [Magnetospira thiophila]
MRRRHLLILGGTREALALARATWETFRVTTSLAGTTSHPTPPPGALRIGGFGGTEGLTRYLRDEFVDLLVDATHPYAARMSRQAREACALAQVPRVQLYRPGWTRSADETWIDAETWSDAAARLPRLGRRVFLTIGRQNLAAFARCTDCWFLLRLLEAPDPPLTFPNHHLLIGPPAARIADEMALMRTHRIDLLVSRDSGGAAAAKIGAARHLDLPILTVRRPPPEPGPRVETVAEALQWLGLGTELPQKR